MSDNRRSSRPSRAKDQRSRPKTVVGAFLTGVLRVFVHPVVSLPLLLVAAAGAGLAWGSWQNLCATCPSVAQIKTWEPEQTAKLLAHDGRHIIDLGYQRRTPVAINALPSYIPQAVIAIEDKRFYQHGGFDPRGILRAVFGVAVGDRSRGGGSTITQQLARNMFPEGIGFDRRVTRKLKEVQVALQLEDSYAKDHILEAYMNEIYMGRGWGFQNASRAYLGKDLMEIDVAEAALLAAILNRPGAYDPFRNPENAMRRRNLVLDRMAQQGYLTREAAATWKSAPLPSEDHSNGSLYGIAPYFEEWVRQILYDRYGDAFYRSGFRVYTTLDLDVQRAAVEAMEWGWQRIEDAPGFRHPNFSDFDTVTTFPGSGETPYVQGALISLDPHTGHVLALVGGRDFEQSKFDRARQAERQAGSSFKPFVYAAAILSDLPASHVVIDEPYQYPEVDGTIWEPRNFDGTFQGPMTLRDALRQSINVVAVRLGWEEVGIQNVANIARRLGIPSRIELYPSTTIGAVGVRPIHLAEAYSTFASLGTRSTPFPIVRVENARGEVVWEPQPQRLTVMDSVPARIMISLLEDAANRGTAGGHRTIGGLPGEVMTAGKTGTTNEGADIWFAGFTPNLLAVVWFGMDRPQAILRSANGATGGAFAAPVWGRFMNHVYYGNETAEGEDEVGSITRPVGWGMPIGITTREVDRKTGKLWSNTCGNPAEHRYTEIYIPGTEPRDYCDDSGPTPMRRTPGGR